MRTCYRCNLDFPEPDMAVGKNTCKSCEALIKREWRRDNGDHYRAYHKEYRKKYSQEHPGEYASRMALYRATASPEKVALHKLAHDKVYRAKLQKRPCAVCGALDVVHAHHEDYSEPLKVVWLCPYCHSRLHNEGGN